MPFDPNEGWNAYHAAAAMTGKPLYPDAGSFIVNNYPPLSFYIVGALGRILGDNIIAGRIISLLAFPGIAFGIFVAVRSMRCGRSEALFSALLFAACLLVTSDYVGMDDPQLLGHAIGIAGFILLLREPRNRRSITASALLFTLAGFAKHNLIVQPLAMVLWLLIYDRSAAWKFIVSGVVFLSLGLLAFRLTYGIDLLTVLNSARVYSFQNLTANLSSWLVWGAIPIIGLAILILLRHRDGHVVLCALYALIAIAVGTAFFGGDGVDMNAMFDADVALALGVGLALNRLPARNILALVYAAPVALAVWQFSDSEWLERDFWLHPLKADAEAANGDIAFLKAKNGPVLCETLSLCYWADKQAEVDVFNVGEQFATGARSDKVLTELIDQRYFRTLQFESLSSFALTPRIREAVVRNYRVDHTNDDGVFLISR
ncbi:MAG TPA: 6-pyruvoyl-tetrahydropterin synthase-related protein [Rhizomicrobium sp.]|nr:6-pyruvoyl-tetrahydropterin synthase-related protein [Rhizomicrobium sp.]